MAPSLFSFDSELFTLDGVKLGLSVLFVSGELFVRSDWNDEETGVEEEEEEEEDDDDDDDEDDDGGGEVC